MGYKNNNNVGTKGNQKNYDAYFARNEDGRQKNIHAHGLRLFAGALGGCCGHRCDTGGAGHETTLPITLDQMIYHASSVVRGVQKALVVVDLPFGTYQGNSKKALQSAIRIMKESGAHAVKLEGGTEIGDAVKRILSAGVPVMGHLGLTPQSIYKFGTYSVRAKEEMEANKLKSDALFLQEIGCFAIVLEKIPATLGEEVSRSLHIPTIGIGAGGGTDGQVLVTHDLLGITKEFKPRFLRRYMELFDEIKDNVQHYIQDVKSGDFPNSTEQY